MNKTQDAITSAEFDIVIQTDAHSVDMKSGIDTLKGTSDATRYVAETVLSGKVIKKQSHKSPVRTTLKQSFIGSYGHTYSLDIYDQQLANKFNKIGKATFSEIISYFISESLYIEHKDLTDKAQSVIDDLGDEAYELVRQLRVSALQNIHEISTKFGHQVLLRAKSTKSLPLTIATFNQTTALSLKAIKSSEKLDLYVCITRLNIYTGNGRFLVKGTAETVAFGFGIEYKEVKLEAKKKFSENLDANNGTDEDKLQFLRVSATPIKLKDGKIVKYIVRNYYD